jgi:simple sugar transport system ATP-binding protein
MLECKGITKRFPGVTALDRVSFSLGRNRITGVLGENGAGKSTLMNIIFGMVRPDEGEMLLEGKAYEPRSPAEAMARGIGMVHQNQMLIEDFTVTENIILGQEPVGPGNLIDFRDADTRIEKIFRDLGSRINPRSRMSDLDPFERQETELAKVLFRNVSLIILDESTSLLAPRQIEQFFSVLSNLKKAGKTILLVTHRIAEVEAIVDDVLVLSRGRLAEFCPIRKIRKSELVSLIISGSREKSHQYSDDPSSGMLLGKKKKTKKTERIEPTAAIFELSGVTTNPSASGRRLENISLKINRGEIVGITGVPGNGQTELLELAAGIRSVESGKIFFDGEEIPSGRLEDIRKKPVGYIFPDRDEQGLIPSFSLEENLLLSSRMLSFFSLRGWLKRRKMLDFSDRAVADFSIKNAAAGMPVSALSGGNRQKVVLARELFDNVKLVVAGEPLRGLDIKTAGELKDRFVHLKNSGAGALIISGDLDFLFSIADRIGAIYKGTINYLEEKASTDMDELNRAILGYK